ncbi:MAG: GAF domain-containing protein [Clostridia bacterium]|nr:GAF domain-containing protein [Deltaproteobacteria bacterium]
MSESSPDMTRLRQLASIGVALSSEKNHARLLEVILIQAKEIAKADGGTIYLRTKDDYLEFAIMRTDSLGIAFGGTTGKEVKLPKLPMYDPVTGEPNHHNVATYAALEGVSLNIPDAYHAAGFDFSGTKKFDAVNGYRSTSFLTIPMKNNKGEVIGVLQLLNARNDAGEHMPFATEVQEFVESLASQAAVAIDNQRLIQAQRDLLDAFIRLIADAIDKKSPYTGGHCKRVPLITEMLARAACDAKVGPFSAFNLDEDGWYELHIAGYLHDCGKIVTPVHVMDKATKLEAIYDRIKEVEARFEILKRDIEIAAMKKRGKSKPTRAQIDAELAQLDADFEFIRKANIGGEFMDDASIARVEQISKRRVRLGGVEKALIDDNEILNLSIRRGTLNDEERKIINDHIVVTIEMLEKLPFPRHLERVTEYAGGHHEKMDGTGYPRGLTREQMSIPARMMAVADVFEALTAQDRPYKSGKKLSEAMKIMGFMKQDNHLDPEIFDLFVSSKVYRAYAERFLPTELIDNVDEEALLKIQPKLRLTKTDTAKPHEAARA